MRQIGVYYFPNWHRDAHNARWFHDGWTEWDLVAGAAPRWPGHVQPKVPLWGMQDESDPTVMRRKSQAAREAGIDAFIFDWYWYDGPFLNRALDDGFLADGGDLKFGLMWANHDWVDVFPAQAGRPGRVLASGAVTPETFRAATDHMLEHYLGHERIWRIAGGAYLSFYILPDLVASLGGVDEAARTFEELRERAASRGVGPLHLAATTNTMDLSVAQLRRLGLDSVTTYTWLHHVDFGNHPTAGYAEIMSAAVADWPRLAGLVDVPYAPNVSTGWDSTPRVSRDSRLDIGEWPFLPVLVDNLPTLFAEAVTAALTSPPAAHGSWAPYLTVNAWNEWTEGAYLEPDAQWGDAHLKALAQAIAALTPGASPRS